MLQNSSKLTVIDNSGAKIVYCIKVLKGYKQRYGFMGNLIMVSIKNLRSQKKEFLKIKRGDIVLALIVRTKFFKKVFSSDSYNFLENGAILLTKQRKPLATRIFGAIPKFFRFSKFFKLLMISAGILL